MGQERLKRPRSAKRRTLPPDATSLIAMIRALHRKLVQRGGHLQAESHDYRARRGFRDLHGQRAAAFQKLIELDVNQALSLAGELGITALPGVI